MTSRRDFLCRMGMAAGAMGGLGAYSDLVRIAAAAPPAAGEYRALVCLFMFGGNDANNMVIPMSVTEGGQYDNQRGNVRLNRAQCLPIPVNNAPGRDFAIHPAMTGMQALCQAGKAAVVANVGPLLAPTTQAQYRNRSVPLPMNLFSHSDQQSQWQSSISDEAPRTGWGGRIADLMLSLNGTNTTSTAISVAGNNLFQNGTQISSYKVSPSAGFGIGFYKGVSATDPVSMAVRETLQASRANVFDQTWNAVINRAIDNQAVLQAAISGATINTVFPNGGLADELKMIARLISARQQLGLTRQIFFCSIGGFDTHGDDQLQRQNELLGEISGAVKAFYDATVEMGISDKVTLFTGSDFSRNFPSNGKGTDHAWGSNHFVVGGAVQGGKMYGTYPTIVINGPDDAGEGRWIPTTSVDQMAATLATWFGVSASDLPLIFPKVTRFNTANLGFLG